MPIRWLPPALWLALTLPAPAQDAPPTPPEKPEKKEEEGKGRGKGKGKEEGRALAPDSEVGKKLAERLAIDPRYAEDGSVELIYTFKSDEEWGDWSFEGFDRADEARIGGRGGRGRNRPAAAKGGEGRALDLGASSSQPGLMRHALAFVGDFELVVTLRIDRSTSDSDLVLFRGEAGLRWGGQLVRRSGGSFKPVVGEPDREPFAGGRVATVRLVHADGKLVAFASGKERAETSKLMEHLDGQVGLFVKGMLLRVDRIEVRGKPDPKKL